MVAMMNKRTTKTLRVRNRFILFCMSFSSVGLRLKKAICFLRSPLPSKITTASRLIISANRKVHPKMDGIKAVKVLFCALSLCRKTLKGMMAVSATMKKPGRQKKAKWLRRVVCCMSWEMFSCVGRVGMAENNESPEMASVAMTAA